MHILLKTERLVLRRFTREDADHLFQLDNDPEVMRYLNGGIPTPRAVIVDEILPDFLRYDECSPLFGFWAAVGKTTGDFLGWLSLRPTDETTEVAAIGYRICRAAWGNGYATEGMNALIRKCFEETEVQRVVATTYEENRASRRVMEKLGMKFVKSFRITQEDLENVDTFHTETIEAWDGEDVEYDLEKTDWDRRN